MHEGNRSLSFERPLPKHEYESKEPIFSRSKDILC